MIEAGEFILLNRYQRDFPLVARPYAAVGAQLGLDENGVIEGYRRLMARGVLSRVGAVFRPNTVGASLLAALAVPEGDLERVAAVVSAYPEVNHNYEREHVFNLWFVVAAAGTSDLDRVLAQIEADTGLEVLRLPLAEEFHIDLGFDLESGAVPRGTNASAGTELLGEAERRLVGALSGGLPLVRHPYEALGRAAGLSGEQVIARLRDWLARGVVRRIGTVVRHRPLGYGANAMVVWDVPDEQVGEAGRVLAAQSEVTLCYRRERRPPRWNYNLFCMLHGVERAPVREAIELVTRTAGLESVPRALLFSRRCFAQRAAQYGAAHG
ncbi:MAG: Lrp/AsnC family transcriptional regulator [Betaproteobacteria bacterium]|nr:Lrp/AsnC family transcriptional regulator [Betaproteobacteria bacterium]